MLFSKIESCIETRKRKYSHCESVFSINVNVRKCYLPNGVLLIENILEKNCVRHGFIADQKVNLKPFLLVIFSSF